MFVTNKLHLHCTATSSPILRFKRPSIDTSKSPLPLAGTTLARRICALASLLLHVEHQAEHVETELRVLQAEPLEFLLGLVPEHVAPGGPEGSHGLPDRLVLGRSLLVHEARVSDFALGGRLCEVNLLVGNTGKCRQTKSLSNGVDAGMAEESDTAVVWARDGRVVFHGVAADGGEVIALVDVLENGGTGVDIIVGQFNTTRRAGHEALNFALEVRRLHEEALVGRQSGLRIA
jgi:hypothetical protein